VTRVRTPFAFLLVAGASLGLVAPATIAHADTNPATSVLGTDCVAAPAVSTGSQSGSRAVAVGESVALTSRVTIGPGDVYQDVLHRPDGSTYYATFIRLRAVASPLAVDNSSVKLTVNGATQPLTPGTAPAVGGFVVDRTIDASGTTWTVYFPGDVATMLAQPVGTGAVSYTAPAGGATIDLSVQGKLADVPAVVSGARFGTSECSASISTGTSNRATAQAATGVAVVEPNLQITKTVSPLLLTPGGTATYTLTLSNPDPEAGRASGTAYDIDIVDTPSAGLHPLNISGFRAAIGDAIDGGGVWNGTGIVFRIPSLARALSLPLTYRMQVDPTLDPSLSVTLSNSANATTSGLPGLVVGERSYGAGPVLASGVAGIVPPRISKVGSPGQSPLNVDVAYTVMVTVPANGAPIHNVTLWDDLPDGMRFTTASPLTIVCSSGCLGTDPTGSSLGPIVTSADGISRVGWYLGTLGSNTVDRTYRITYPAQIKPTKTIGTVALHDTFVNTTRVGYNAIDRLGVVRPNLGRPLVFDSQAAANATVEYDRPIVRIAKTSSLTGLVDPDPAVPPLYTITLTNTGGVDALNVDMYDYMTLQMDPLVPGLPAGVTSLPGNWFRVANVPAGGSTSFSYTGRWQNYGVGNFITNNAYLNSYRNPATNSFYPSGEPGASAQTIFQLGASNLAMTKRAVTSPAPVSGPITWEVTLANIGNATARGIAVVDALPAGWTISNVVGATAATATSFNVPGNLPPGSSTSFRFDTTPPAGEAPGTFTNKVTARWHDGRNQPASYYPTYRDFSAEATGTVTLVRPRLTVQKKPDLTDMPTPIVQQNGTGNFTITVQNPTTIPVYNIDVNDVLPAELAFIAGSDAWVVNPTPAVPPTVTLGSDANGPIWHVSALEPGSVFQVSFSTLQNGALPASGQMANGAVVNAPGLASPVSDLATVLFAPDIAAPVVTKMVNPAFGSPGTAVTYTITATVPANVVSVFDVALEDTIPDGITFGSITSSACTGACPHPSSPVLYAAQSNAGTGETALRWFLGDHPASATPSTYVITFTGSVNANFHDGAQVIDQVRDPIINIVHGFYSADVARDQPTPSAGSMWPGSAPWQYLTATANASFDVRTPSLAMTKQIVGHTPFDWTDAVTGNSSTVYALDPNETVTYELVVKNRGSAPAIGVVISDDLAAGELSNVTFNLPAGVAAVPQLDGSVRFAFASPLAAGASLTLSYTGTVPDSANLSPDLSGDSRDVDAVVNQVHAIEYHTAGVGQPGDRVFSDSNNPSTIAYVYTPTLETVSHACYKVQPGDSQEVSLDWSNRVTRNGGNPPTPPPPPDSSKGVAVAPVLTVTLPAGLVYLTGTARATGQKSANPTSVAPTAFRNPDSVSVDGSGQQVLVWNFTNTPYTPNGMKDLYLYFRVSNSTAAELKTAVRSNITASDATGSPNRGSASGASHTYAASWVAGCQNFELYKYPDGGDYFPGQTVNWSFATANDVTEPFNLAHGTFTDTLPIGLTYQPGSFVLDVTAMSGAVTTYYPGDVGYPTETVTTLPDGSQRMTWSGGAMAAGVFRDAAGRFATTINPSAPVNSQIVNYVDFRNDVEMFDACAEPNTECDTGRIFVLDPNVPQVSKTVDRVADVYGSSPIYKISVRIPKNTTYSQLKVVDTPSASPFRSLIDGTFTTISAACVAGCTPLTDITVTPMARSTVGSSVVTTSSAAWYLGSPLSASDDRVVEIVYQARTINMTEYAVVGGPLNENDSARTFANVASLRANSGGCAAPGCVQSPTSGTQLDESSAAVTLRFPWVKHDKQCASLSGGADPAPTLAGTNLRCKITLTNPTGTPAYDFMVRDYPSTTSTSAPTFPVSWNVIGYSGDALPSTPWSSNQTDGTGRYVGWSIPVLGAGQSIELMVDFNVDGWTGNPQGTTQTGTSVNRARLFPWKLTPTSSTTVGVATTSTASVRFRPTQLSTSKLRVHSDHESQALLNEWVAAPDTLDTGLPPGASTYQEHLPGDRVEWALHTWMVNKSDIATLSLTDTLPYGVRYVPGSARLVSVDRDSSSGVVLSSAFTPIGDPSLGAGAGSPCPAFGDLPIGGSGDVLRWSFTKDAPGWLGAPWRADGTAELKRRVPMNYDQDGHVILVFDVEHTAAVNTCVNPLRTSGHGIMVNYASASGTTAAARAVPAANTEFKYAYHNPLQLSKMPDGGSVASGDNAGFNIDLTWWMYGNGSVAQWTPTMNVAADPHVSGPVTFTDTFVDDGLYVPGSATATIVGPDGVSYPSAMSELSAIAGIDAASGRVNRTITWQIPSLPPSAIDPSSPYNRSNPYRRKPVLVSIGVPFHVPVGTPDGTRYTNDVSVTVATQPTVAHPSFLDSGSLTTSDVGDITALNPSPPPTAIKTVSPTTAPAGSLVDWTVSVPLPANEVWYELAYADQFPAGLELVSYLGSTCLTASSVPCPVVPSMIAVPVAGTQGPFSMGWSFGDVPGAREARNVALKFRARVNIDQAGGAQLTNTVRGYSEKTDLGDAVPTVVPTAGFFVGAPSSGVVTVGAPHLLVAKTTTTPGPLTEGDTVRYAVTITNDGPVTAYEFDVRDAPSPAIENIVLTGSNASRALDGWTAADPALVWFVGSLAAGASTTFTYEGKVRVGYANDGTTRADNVVVVGPYHSQATTQPHAVYPVVSDDLSIALNGPRLAIEKFASSSCTSVAATFAVGVPFTWCLVVHSTGTAAMRLVDVSDFLPAGWSYQTGSATVGGLGQEPVTTTTSWGTSKLVWPIGDIAPGGDVTIVYTSVPAASAGSQAINVASASGHLPNGDPSPAAAADYNVVGISAAAQASANIEIGKTPADQSINCYPASPTTCLINWTLTVANPGGADVHNVILRDTLPAGLTWLTSSLVGAPAGWAETTTASGPAGSTVRTWTGPVLAAGARFTVDVAASSTGVRTDDIVRFNYVDLAASEIPAAVEKQARVRLFGGGLVSDFVWADANGNGLQDSGELGIDNVPVDLLDEGGNILDSVTTDGVGHYAFKNVMPAKYQVKVHAPFGWTFTVADVESTTDSLDSDVDAGTGLSGLFAIAPGQDRTDIDAGMWQAGSIGDLVWDDDGDGVKQLAEVGRKLVDVKLSGTSGSGASVTRATTTDTLGHYSFDGLEPGTYVVTFVSPTGTLFVPKARLLDRAVDSDADTISGSTAPITVRSADLVTSIDAGLFAGSSVSGRVFVDANNDGIWATGDADLRGVKVTLTGTDDLGNTISIEIDTLPDGSYRFVGLRPGTYMVTETQPTGYLDGNDTVGSRGGALAGTADSVTGIVIRSGDIGAGYNFAELAPASLAGSVFTDADNDGLRESGDLPIENVTVVLTGADDRGASVTLTAVTTSTGAYVFTNLRPGTYVVRETQPMAYLDGLDTIGSLGGIADTDATASIVVHAGDSAINYNFAELAAATIGNFVWTDLNANGVQDSGETGIGDVAVMLTGTDDLGPVALTVRTDGSGNYAFTAVRPGSYVVSFPIITGSLSSPISRGTVATDSNPATGNSVTLAAGGTDATIDHGYYQTVTFGDRVWFDRDDNGIVGSNEPGLGGVTVRVTSFGLDGVAGGGDDVSASTSTLPDGTWAIVGLMPGTYTVSVASPVGYGAGFDLDGITTPNSATLTALSGTNRSDIDFGLRGTGSLGDRIWLDADADGVIDAREAGVAGATVSALWFGPDGVRGGGDDLTFVTVTDETGSWSIAFLPSGVYQVSVSGLQVGLEPTSDPDGLATINTAPVTLAAGASDNTLDFGYRFPPGSIGGNVWNDVVADGTLSAADVGLGGITVVVTSLGPDGVPGGGDDEVTIVVTKADGTWSLAGLQPGRYHVAIDVATLPSGVRRPVADPDGIETTPHAATLDLTSGESRSTLDFAYTVGSDRPISVASTVFHDQNCNGVKDGNEPGLANIAVTLRLPDGSTRVATTDDLGAYVFTDLPAGPYVLTVGPSPGWRVDPACGDSLSFTVNADGVGNASFGLLPASTKLPATGSDVRMLLLAAAALLASGVFVVVIARRRRAA
jgi:fimbrial isopeptide formation D2 family protein/uncharacterized repeat protein (TIGR01451 family)